VDKHPQQLSPTKLEINPSGTPSGNGLRPATLETRNIPKANSENHIPRYSQMGTHTSWKFHSQRGMHSTRKIPKYTKILHLDNNMEIKTLAQNLHIPMASNLEQDLNLGQSSKTRFYWPIDLPSLPSSGRNHGAPPKQLFTQ
jgi:hypothetical protein